MDGPHSSNSTSDLVCCPVILLKKSGANTVWEMLKEPPVCFDEHAGWPACPGRKGSSGPGRESTYSYTGCCVGSRDPSACISIPA